MENFSCHSNESTWTKIIRKSIHVEANAMNLYAMYLLHSSMLFKKQMFIKVLLFILP